MCADDGSAGLPPHRYFSECWVFCLVYRSLDCAAIEWEPDEKGKEYIEDTDKGTCYIQRRRSATVSITPDPYRHVFIMYQDEPEKALMMMVLSPELRANTNMLRYYAACEPYVVNGELWEPSCANTYGSYRCVVVVA
jgi:hypothetical protein